MRDRIRHQAWKELGDRRREKRNSFLRTGDNHHGQEKAILSTDGDRSV